MTSKQKKKARDKDRQDRSETAKDGANPRLKPEELYFIPLGGSEEFGVNFNLYAMDGRFLAVDCGMGFADHRFPGVDILLPDPSFIEARKDSLEGLIVTHAHEDHIGAIAHLWPRLRCPIYCTPFTAAVLRKKFEENPECRSARIQTVKPGETVNTGPFTVEFIHVAHSIPEACALLIGTKLGRVLHSGDWNMDPTPVLSEPTDSVALQKAGREGVLAYIGDSTNANVPGRSISEADVREGLAEVFKSCRGRICITIFASNIGRIDSIARAAKVSGRQVALFGRSLHTMVGAARACGYLRDIPDFVGEDDIGLIPDENLVMLATGSQGEPRAALARMARGEHPAIVLKRGDTVIFSARPIPGNEKDIDVVKNNLSAAGIRIIVDGETKHIIHVSGHPRRDDIIDMLGWVKPQTVIPVHGERVHLEAHADLARECQVPNVLVPANGSVIRLAPGKPDIVDHVPVSLLAVEPNRIIPVDHHALTTRRKLQFTGAIHVTLVLTGRGDLVADPSVTSLGLIDPENPKEVRLETDLMEEIEDILADMERDDLYEDHAVHEEIRIGVRRLVHHVLGIKPNVTIHIVRIDD